MKAGEGWVKILPTLPCESAAIHNVTHSNNYQKIEICCCCGHSDGLCRMPHFRLYKPVSVSERLFHLESSERRSCTAWRSAVVMCAYRFVVSKSECPITFCKQKTFPPRRK